MTFSCSIPLNNQTNGQVDDPPDSQVHSRRSRPTAKSTFLPVREFDAAKEEVRRL